MQGFFYVFRAGIDRMLDRKRSEIADQAADETPLERFVESHKSLLLPQRNADPDRIDICLVIRRDDKPARVWIGNVFNAHKLDRPENLTDGEPYQQKYSYDERRWIFDRSVHKKSGAVCSGV